MDGRGRGLGAPLGLLPFLIHLCHPSCHGQPRALALLATIEWISKGKDLGDHPGLRWPGPEKWLGRGWSCRAEGLGPPREGLGTSLQDSALLAPPTSQPRGSGWGGKAGHRGSCARPALSSRGQSQCADGQPTAGSKRRVSAGRVRPWVSRASCLGELKGRGRDAFMFSGFHLM